MRIFCNAMKNKQINLSADVCDLGRQTFIAPDKSGSAGMDGASCLSERSLPCLNNRPIWCGQGCHSGVFERGFGDAKAVKPLRMKAYGCPEVFLNVFKRQNSLLLPYLGLAQQPARRGVRVFRWLRCRGGRQGFPAGFPVPHDKAVMPGNGGLPVWGRDAV